MNATITKEIITYCGCEMIRLVMKILQREFQIFGIMPGRVDLNECMTVLSQGNAWNKRDRF